MSTDYHVHALFSSPVVLCKVSEDMSALYDALREPGRFEYVITANNIENPGSKNYATTNRRLLDGFPAEKDIIASYFRAMKDNVLRYEDTDFEMTTSWATRSERGSSCHYHAHWNSVFSGVLYFDSDPDAAPIEFTRPPAAAPTFMLNRPAEWNELNCNIWGVRPTEGMLVFFPSHLRHRIGLHESDTPRYSVAFNFFPRGGFGDGDSWLNVEHVRDW